MVESIMFQNVFISENADIWIFLFIKESWKKYSTVLNIDNNNIIWNMISEVSCDTEDCSNDAEMCLLSLEE